MKEIFNLAIYKDTCPQYIFKDHNLSGNRYFSDFKSIKKAVT